MGVARRVPRCTSSKTGQDSLQICCFRTAVVPGRPPLHSGVCLRLGRQRRQCSRTLLARARGASQAGGGACFRGVSWQQVTAVLCCTCAGGCLRVSVGHFMHHHHHHHHKVHTLDCMPYAMPGGVACGTTAPPVLACLCTLSCIAALWLRWPACCNQACRSLCQASSRCVQHICMYIHVLAARPAGLRPRLSRRSQCSHHSRAAPAPPPLPTGMPAADRKPCPAATMCARLRCRLPKPLPAPLLLQPRLYRPTKRKGESAMAFNTCELPCNSTAAWPMQFGTL